MTELKTRDDVIKYRENAGRKLAKAHEEMSQAKATANEAWAKIVYGISKGSVLQSGENKMVVEEFTDRGVRGSMSSTRNLDFDVMEQDAWRVME